MGGEPEEILGPDPGSLDTTTENGGSNDEDSPTGANDRETNAEGDAGEGKLVRGDLHQEESRVEEAALAGEERVETHSREEQGPQQAEVANLISCHDSHTEEEEEEEEWPTEEEEEEEGVSVH